MDLKLTITHNLLNIPGWTTKRKIIVIESDDWGAIRMPSKIVYNQLLSEGYKVDLNPYEKYDSLATENDLSNLFEVLNSFKDKHGHNPMITANCVVANPDFDKIKKEYYTKYFYEPFTLTLSKYHGCEHSFDLWREGLGRRIFIPQYHSREHLNVALWLHLLNSGDEDILRVFKLRMMGISPKNNYKIGDVCQVAYDDSVYKHDDLQEIIKDGLDLFERLFGFNSLTTIAPCYTWNPVLEKTFYEKGVKGIQGLVYQQIPKHKSIRHWMGTKNSLGQIYTIRNCFFEPSLIPNIDYVDDCLFRIKCAFRWNKPAIISSHRINYIGAIYSENRDKNLRLLYELFSEILKRYPDVEFMSSDMLVKTMIHGN